MKKLYQTKVVSEIQIPGGVDRNDFINLVSKDGENGLTTESIILVVAENEEDAILESLCKYIDEIKTSDINNYQGVLIRGETRCRYYINVSINYNNTELQTKVAIELYTEDLGI